MNNNLTIESKSKLVTWTLIDKSNKYFNIWECDKGYRECFWKGVNPNISKKYGINTETMKYI